MKNLKHYLLGVFLITVVISNAQEIGKPAPNFTYDILDGGKFTLSEHSGKVVVLFTFGHNCHLCITSGPYVQSGLVEHYADNNDVVLVGLDVWNGPSASVNTFKGSTGLTIPLLLEAGSLINSYNTAHDRLLVVDRAGILTYRSSTDAGSNVDNAVAAADAALATPVAINSVNADQYNFTSFPNPAQDFVNMSFILPEAGDASIRIISLDGRIVLDKGNSYFNKGGVNQISIDISSLRSGVYLSVLEHEGLQTMQKLIVN